ncbi:hypothetical protein [Spirillospora sp. NPDC048819]|uniref:hypothetical protein n=1 Tax=Spirillospora sp. NPDC048819 TaxID=3155268 RepID=UPI0033E06C28
MAITDDQVATLRAQLAGHHEEHVRRLDGLDTEEAKSGYTTLVTAAFFEAVDRKFIVNDKVAEAADVIDFVAYQREIHPDSADQLDPHAAEMVILDALGKGSIDNIDSERLFGTQILLLAALVGDARFSDDDLDAFLAKARTEADKHLG